MCQSALDLCFILDSSGSIRDNNPPNGAYDNYDLLLTFVNRILDAFTIARDKTRVGVVLFSEKVELVITMNQVLIQINLIDVSFVIYLNSILP